MLIRYCRYKIPTIRVPWRVMFAIATLAEFGKAVVDYFSPRFRKSQLLITKQAVYGVVVTQWFRTDSKYHLPPQNFSGVDYE